MKQQHLLVVRLRRNNFVNDRLLEQSTHSEAIGKINYLCLVDLRPEKNQRLVCK